MRKKSHISLAKYLLNSQGMEMLQKHKKAFYLGSILPDCVPTFLTRRHTIEDTFDILEKEIRKVTENYDMEKGIGSYYCRHIGVITHYVADYFTFPHNSIYPGNMAAHCKYEKNLKFALYDYVNSEEAKRSRSRQHQFQTVNELCEFIMQMHEKYLHAIIQIEIDCEYIVALCHKVVDEILAFFEQKMLLRNVVPA
jgi:hypothetical protein